MLKITMANEYSGRRDRNVLKVHEISHHSLRVCFQVDLNFGSIGSTQVRRFSSCRINEEYLSCSLFMVDVVVSSLRRAVPPCDKGIYHFISGSWPAPLLDDRSQKSNTTVRCASRRNIVTDPTMDSSSFPLSRGLFWSIADACSMIWLFYLLDGEVKYEHPFCFLAHV